MPAVFASAFRIFTCVLSKQAKACHSDFKLRLCWLITFIETWKRQSIHVHVFIKCSFRLFGLISRTRLPRQPQISIVQLNEETSMFLLPQDACVLVFIRWAELKKNNFTSLQSTCSIVSSLKKDSCVCITVILQTAKMRHLSGK